MGAETSDAVPGGGAGSPGRATGAAPPCVRVAGHDLTVFVEWPDLRRAMLADMAAARRRIWVEVYIFANDIGGTLVAETLRERARAGLDVRVLYDAVGSQWTPGAFFADMAAAGVRVQNFHSIWEALARGALAMLDQRNHRKLLVIDDRIAYWGGMNIVDNLAAGPRGAGIEGGTDGAPGADGLAAAAAACGWRDVHVRLEGPQAADLAESFERSWQRARGERLTRRPKAYRKPRLIHRAGPLEFIRFFDSGPGPKYSRGARVFGGLLRHARRSVFLAMAYFIPVGMPLRTLLRARRRGVRVRIVIPGKSDVPLVQHATAHLYAKLLRRGFRLYERRDRMLHAKVMVVDEEWTVVGSCNFDPRSLYINLELVGVVRSARFAQVLTEIVRTEIGNSTRVTLAMARRASWPARLRNRLAWALRWWL